jgi:hypothetical protein
VPPSPPSTVTKSTPLPVRAMRPARSSQNAPSPTADLMPTGRPVSAAMVSTSSSSPSTSRNAECPAGLLQSTPTGTPRMAAISGVTLAPGSMPPRPGLAPWLNLISMARIDGVTDTRSIRRGRLKVPSSLRQPK